MKTYEQFLDEVMPHVPGCPNAIAINAIRNAAIEFCEKSLVVQRDHELVSVVRNVADYDLEAPTGQVVAKIMRAWFQATPLMPIAPDEVGSIRVYNARAEGADGPGDPRYIIQKNDTTFSLYPVPKENKPLSIFMRVAMKPSRASTQVEDVLFEDYLETIAAGARARLMLMPGKPYTSPELALANKTLFDQGVNLARHRATMGNTRANIGVRLRRI